MKTAQAQAAKPTVAHATFVIERHYPATPERVFTAFADPAKKRRWFAEGEGFKVLEFEMDFRVGGSERASFRAQGGPMKDVVFANATRIKTLWTTAAS